MVSPLKVSSGQFPFHCSLGVSTRKARLAGVLHPVVDIVALYVDRSGFRIGIGCVAQYRADLHHDHLRNLLS